MTSISAFSQQHSPVGGVGGVYVSIHFPSACLCPLLWAVFDIAPAASLSMPIRLEGNSRWDRTNALLWFPRHPFETGVRDLFSTSAHIMESPALFSTPQLAHGVPSALEAGAASQHGPSDIERDELILSVGERRSCEWEKEGAIAIGITIWKVKCGSRWRCLTMGTAGRLQTTVRVTFEYEYHQLELKIIIHLCWFLQRQNIEITSLSKP